MSQTQNKLRILIVDDSVCMRNVLRTLMKSADYDVVGDLSDGTKLLPVIDKLSPHIICLDYNLPGTDGLSLLKEVHSTYPNIAVIMITGSENPELEVLAVEAGSSGFIRKPFSQEQILTVLKKVEHAQRLLLVAEKKQNPFEEKPYRATAVIADDSLTLRKLLKAILSHMGIEVVGEAHDGKQAAELVALHKPDIVCLDFEMPVMNGLDALKIIRSQNAAIKVVMVTAMASRELFIRATKAGANGYIIKPFHPDKITENISQVLAS